MAELDRLDREHGLGAMPTSAARPVRRRGRREHGPVLPGLLITGLLVAGIVAVTPTDQMLATRRLFGFDDDRLAAAPEIGRGGSYSFLQTQRGSREPVGYDPCRPIEVVVNPAGAPPGYDALVDTGLAHTAAATGLEFVRVGDTEDREVLTGPFARRRPVLIMWALPDEVPELAGDVAGIGGSVAVGEETGRMRYVTGRVVLDQAVFASYGPDEAAYAQAIVDHELAHVVGLGHVDDPGELMYDDNVGRTTYGPGDLEGLARLGSISC